MKEEKQMVVLLRPTTLKAGWSSVLTRVMAILSQAVIVLLCLNVTLKQVNLTSRRGHQLNLLRSVFFEDMQDLSSPLLLTI